jgi:hypothetical protein
VTVETPPRSIGAAVSDLRYAVEYASLNESFWSHVDASCNLLQALFGALALAGVLGDLGLVRYAGGGLAVISGVQLALSPCKRTMEFRHARVRFHELLSKSGGMDVIDVDAQLELLRGAAPLGMRTLSRPAYNIVAEGIGKPEERYKLTAFERVLLALS